MRKILVATLVILAMQVPVFGQLTVSNAGNNGNVNFLVPQVLYGVGMDIFNQSYLGNTSQLGTFSGNGTTLPFQDGIILCTGDITAAIGPNDTTSFTSPPGGFGNIGDPDLDQLSGISTTDAAVMEFDFRPKGNSVWLRYSFASEEYNEEVCSPDVDQIGIFVSGPGINGPYTNNAINIATTPAAWPVSVNSINNGTVGAGNNTADCFNGAGLLASGLYNDNSVIGSMDSALQFDGWTSALTAMTNLECDSLYHLKIVIAKGGNNPGESALLLESGSLGSNGVTASLGGFFMGDTAMVEGCGPAILTFVRPDSTGTGTMDISISGSAINGTDYTLIDSTVTWQPGESNAEVVISALADGVTEGNETVTVTYVLVNPCGFADTVTYSLLILDEYVITTEASASDSLICEGDAVTITGTGGNGNGPYIHNWDGVQGPASFTATPSVTTTYSLETFDQAGCPATSSVTVEVNAAPTAEAGPDRNVCTNVNEIMGETVSGVPGSVITWTPPTGLNNPNIANPTLTPIINTTYTVTVTTPAGCTATDDVTVTVYTPPTAIAGPDESITYGDSVMITGAGSTLITWFPPEGLSCTACPEPMASPQQTTTYEVRVTDQWGCFTTAEVTVDVFVPEEIFVPTGFSPNGDGYNDVLFVRGYTLEGMEFMVFDQWGTRVFKTIDPNEGWNGMVGGTPAPADVYTWVVKGRFINGTENAFSGTTTLVR